MYFVSEAVKSAYNLLDLTLNMKNNLVLNKSVSFALAIIDLFKQLQQSKEYVLSKQLLRSGTSIGANITEAIAGESKKDFLHKLYIALKEARETQFWLFLLYKGKFTTFEYDTYDKEIESIINILSKSIKTTKENINNK